MRKLLSGVALATAVITVSPLASQIGYAQKGGKQKLVKVVACPSEGLIFDNKCYIISPKDVANPAGPTFKPICYPGYFIKLPDGNYRCGGHYAPPIEDLRKE